MSEIKQINTGVAEIIAVKVPEGAHSFIVRGGSLIYDDNGKESWWPQVYLPSDNWQILGLSDHLNEEQCRPLFKNKDGYGQSFELPAPNHRSAYFTAKKSFASLMQANGCYSVNPYDKPSLEEFKSIPFCESGDCQAYRDELKQWQQAEANTGTYLILKRLS